MPELTTAGRDEDPIDPARLHWITGRPVPLDHDGPTDVPFAPLPEAWFDQPLLDSYADIAARHPDRIALADGSVRLTFDETRRCIDDLVARADAVAPPGRPVAAIVRNDVAFPIAYLAAFGLGRPLLILSPGDPPERQAAILAEARPGALIVAAGIEPDESVYPPDLPRVVLDPRVPGRLPRPGITIDLDTPCHIVFTSGSTGKPKGITRSQRQTRARMPTEIGFFHLGSHDVLVGLAPPSHAGVWAPPVAAFSGATLRLLDMKTIGVEETLRVMGDEGVTILPFVPSALRTLMKIPGIERAFRRVRVLAASTERVQMSDVALFRSRLPPGCRIAILLGSMDVSMLFRWFVPDGGVEGGLPVGYLDPGRTVAVVGEDGLSVPAGEAGELYVRGRDLAVGAWQGGQLVQGTYQRDPDDPEGLIYATRDMVLQRPDGLFEFLGRADQMVKIRGLRVDLGEVEAALRALPGVADAVAVVHIREGETDRLVAFVAPAPGATLPPEAEMRRSVGAATAAHMAPSEVRVLPTIPRLYNHKADLVRLRALASESRQRG